MNVTKVRVTRVVDPTSKVIAFADILLDDVLEISHIRLVEGRNGVFPAMPSWRSPDTDDGPGKWADFVIPHDEALRQEITDKIMTAFQEAE